MTRKNSGASLNLVEPQPEEFDEVAPVSTVQLTKIVSTLQGKNSDILKEMDLILVQHLFAPNLDPHTS